MTVKHELLVYDTEIVKAILKEEEKRIEGIEYCDGFHDHKNCGISVICAHDWKTGRYRVFTQESFKEFEELASQRLLAGFNSISFDDQVLNANGLKVKTGYDLLVECWAADGLGPEYEYPSHAGFGLNVLSKANGLAGKTGHGAKAPVDWQRGNYGSVIDYCLEDVRLTSILIHQVMHGKGRLINPKTDELFQNRLRQP